MIINLNLSSNRRGIGGTLVPPYDSMPEWSKGSGSSSDVFVLVGSNPTAVKILFFMFFLPYLYKYIYIKYIYILWLRDIY